MTENTHSEFEARIVDTLKNQGCDGQLQFVGMTTAKQGNFAQAPEHIQKAVVEKMAEKAGVEVIPKRYHSLLGDEWEPEDDAVDTPGVGRKQEGEREKWVA